MSDVLNWSKALYSKGYFLGKGERSWSCLAACPFHLEDGHLTLPHAPSSIHLLVLFLLNFSITGVYFCL